MDWFDLLKQPKLRVGSKVTTNIGSGKESEEKTPCKEQLLNYISKVKNMAETGFKNTRVRVTNFAIIINIKPNVNIFRTISIIHSTYF